MLDLIFWLPPTIFCRFACSFFCCFRIILFPVCLSHNFSVPRSVQTYADIFGGHRYKMSGMSSSVSEAESIPESPTCEMIQYTDIFRFMLNI
jgi:hypothetical protein